MAFYTDQLEQFDLEIGKAIAFERQREETHLELIASENYVSPQVLAAQGSILTNKYAEGYPSKRYYAGCKYIDQIEQLALDRAKKLFHADYANVQPHSGSQANQAAYMALLKPGDPILGMRLEDGGHLTHGSRVSFSGKFYRSYAYGVNPKTGEIDYDEVEQLAKKYRPKLIVAGFSAYSRIVNWLHFREIANQVQAYFLADIAHVAGLVAVGLYPSPIACADVVTATTHKTLRGPRGGLILAQSNPSLERKLDAAVFPGVQGGPLMHVIAAKAVAFLEAAQHRFVEYQQQVLNNARIMAKIVMQRGYNIVSGGTDNHLFIIDLTDKNLTGQLASSMLQKAHITTNKNTIPNDSTSPMVTSGVRIGSPAITTRGLREKECIQVANWLCDVLDHSQDDQVILGIKNQVIELCKAFPVYGLYNQHVGFAS